MENFDKNAQKFADLMINKIESISTDWKKPWFSKKLTSSTFLPQNITGRTYASGNAFLLFFLTEKENFQTPVFLTFKQAKAENTLILKGSESFPVYYNVLNAYHRDTDEKITYDEFKELTAEEKKCYRLSSKVKYYLVFNLDQTNFSEIHPERWEVLKTKFSAPVDEDAEELKMYCNPILDNMLLLKSWVCPITLKASDKACYFPILDKIELPLKNQFVDGESFYSTQLHEMAHSTGIESRCNRTDFQDRKKEAYGREELVAEFTAALSGVLLGISSGIRDENAAYLKSWMKSIKQDPKFLLSVLSDSLKASKFIAEKLNVTLAETIDEVE
jgi:antirestriction protein ArdC